MHKKLPEQLNHQRSKLFVAMGAVALIGAAPAYGMGFDTGNRDLSIRWDNTVKYNAGWRVASQDDAIVDNWLTHASDGRFEKGDMVTNRFDLLSEFDVIYKRKHGFRVSAAAWKDFAYDNDVEGNPAYMDTLGTAYPNDRFTNEVSRYYTSSGEILDAFAFTSLDVGDSPVFMKLGRHTVYWGESLFSPIHGVSYSQGPVDFRKALATPGSEAKELFLPLNQFSFQASITPKISVSGQYFLEWDSYRLAEGGTYLAYFDPYFSGGTDIFGLPHRGDFNTPDDRGNWGLSSKIMSDTLAGTVGIYYREFDDKVPAVLFSPDFSYSYNAYAEDIKLYGLSYSRSIGPVSVAAEVVYREDSPLNAVGTATEIPRGNTWHALANMIGYIGTTPLFDAATVNAELTYSRVASTDSSTEQFFNSVDNGCQGGTDAGCSTKDAWGISLAMTPTWYQVFPGVDMTMPLSYSRGLDGYSPVPFGGAEDSGSGSIGVGLDIYAKYLVTLTYNDYFGPLSTGPNPNSAIPGIGDTQWASFAENGLIRDRDWVSLTLKTSF